MRDSLGRGTPAMTCFLVNGSFLLAMLTILPGGILGVLAQRNRAPNAPPPQFWRQGWDLFRPALFTERGNQFRRLGLILTWTGAALLLVCVTLLFMLRGDSLGICWFQS